MTVTRLALITTTINVPHVLTEWADCLTKNDVIIVAGDLKSPHDEIDLLVTKIRNEQGVRAEYVEPQDQRRWASSEIIGWNCIQRRNIALLEALSLKPEFILTIDDDNAPTVNDSGQITTYTSLMNHHTKWKVATSRSGWANPGNTCEPRTIHRGMPLSQRHTYPTLSWRIERAEIGVAEMMVLGDPDIDAVERICHAPEVTNINDDIALAPGTWAPFNSQAVIYRAELAPLMMVWPGVGRYDDIWASYLARCIMDSYDIGVYYGAPAVRQERNEHDLLKDLEAEMFGMRWTSNLVQILRDVQFDERHVTVVDKLRHVYVTLDEKAGFLPEQTKNSFVAWLKDLASIGVGAK